MDPTAITATGLRVRRGGREVLHSLSFRVNRGSVTGLLGANGSGKTTLMRSIVGRADHRRRHTHRARPSSTGSASVA